MSNASILAGVDTLVATVVTDLATLASAKSAVTALQASLATAQSVVAADLADSITSSSTLAARLPAEQALVQVLETQLAAAQLAVKTAQTQVYVDSVAAGSNAQSVSRQWRSFQKAADTTTLLNFVDSGKLQLGSLAINDVLAASLADSTISSYYNQFNLSNIASIPQDYSNVTNLSANWTAFLTAFNAVEGITLVATN